MLYSRVEIQDRFFVEFFELFAALIPVLSLVKADVVALIARPEHNLQALNRQPLFRRKKNKKNKRKEERERERGREIFHVCL